MMLEQQNRVDRETHTRIVAENETKETTGGGGTATGFVVIVIAAAE